MAALFWGGSALVGQQKVDSLGGTLIFTESLSTNAPYRLDEETRESFAALGSAGKAVQLIRITGQGKPVQVGLFDLTPRFKLAGDDEGERTGEVIKSDMGNDVEKALEESLAAIEGVMNTVNGEGSGEAQDRALYRGLASLEAIRSDLPIWVYSLGLDTVDPVNFIGLDWDEDRLNAQVEEIQASGQAPKISGATQRISVIFGEVAGGQEPLRCFEGRFREVAARALLRAEMLEPPPCDDQDRTWDGSSGEGNPDGASSETDGASSKTEGPGVYFHYGTTGATQDSGDGSGTARANGRVVPLRPWAQTPSAQCPPGQYRDEDSNVCLDEPVAEQPGPDEPVIEPSDPCEGAELDLNHVFDQFYGLDAADYVAIIKDPEGLAEYISPCLNYIQERSADIYISAWAVTTDTRRNPQWCDATHEGLLTSLLAFQISEKRAEAIRGFIIDLIGTEGTLSAENIHSKGLGTCFIPYENPKDPRNASARISTEPPRGWDLFIPPIER